MKVALYIRVSTEEQAVHGLSIEAQTEALEEWAKINQAVVVGRYIDAGISARKKAVKRPELQRLLGDVRAGGIDVVVFTKLDRWFRNIAEYYKVQEVLEQYHVGWKTIHEDYDTTNASGRLKINIMLSVAQDEADRTSERIKAVFDSKKQRQEPVSGRLPYGYRMENKKAVQDEKTAPAVREFFKQYMSLRSISMSCAEVERLHGERISYYRAKELLGNPSYYGEMNGEKNMCPPYITKEDHDTIAAGRQNYSRKTIKNRVYLFSGIVFCGECGHRLNSRTHRDSQVYNCQYHYQGFECGNNVNILERDIEQFLVLNVNSELERLVSSNASTEENTSVDIPSNIAKSKRKLSRLKDLYINDLIDLDAYKKDYTALCGEIAALEVQLIPETSAPDIAHLKGVFKKGWDRFYNDLLREQKRKFWVSVLREIRVYPDRHIEISFL